MLKTDFHVHTHEDIMDSWLVKYSAKDLIRVAAKQKFQVLSITNHHKVFFNKSIESYARNKGILLLPGAEPRIEGCDVLVININNEQLAGIRKLDDLDKIKDSALIIAPHPYLVTGACLRDKLVKHIDSFHAIEFSHVSTKLMINPFFKFLTGNTKAVEVAKKYHKPLVGTSDAHKLYELGTTYTLVNSAKKKDDVIDAVKRSKITLVANPLPVHLFFRRLLGIAYEEGLIERVVRRKRFNHRKQVVLAKHLNNQ